jgi:[ribosomal protein S18]-alanine N-acetyltransferase
MAPSNKIVRAQVELRPARSSDLDAVVALERATERAPHWARAVYAEMARAAELPSGGSVGEAVRRCIFLAERAGGDEGALERRVVGFAVGAVQESAELESVVVAASARRRGIGRALCEAVMAWCREQGAAEMALEVRATSAGAIAMYARLGFIEIARRVRYYRDPEEDAVVMKLRLERDSPTQCESLEL